MLPQPRPCNARRLSHMIRFSPIRFRSPLLTESLLFSLPTGTEMFHFPALPLRTLCVQMRVAQHDTVRGFPIRKSWSQRPVIDSTRLIADSHVLLRLPMPRHPPCALVNLTTNSQAMSFISISRKTMKGFFEIKEIATRTPTPRRRRHACIQDARVHYAVPKQQPLHPHHTPTTRTNPVEPACLGQARKKTSSPPRHQTTPKCEPVPQVLLLQGPTVCQTPPPSTSRHRSNPDPKTRAY